MGKIKKPRSRPTPGIAPEELVEDELELQAGRSQDNLVQTILDQLQAPNVEEKYCGLQTFALVIDDPARLEQVLESGAVRAAAPLLLDAARSVRNSAAGALRNLSAVGLNVCDSMMEQDIMTPLVAYFHEHASNLVPKANTTKKFDEENDTFVHCVNILWNLCETSGLAIKYFNDSNVLSILVHCLDFAMFGSEITISILQCLFVVSEDNIAATEKIKSECEEKLQSFLQLEGNDPSTLLLRTLAAGVKINTCGGNITSLPAVTINQIMSILANTLSVDHRLACNQLSSTVPLGEGSRKPKAPKGKEGQVLDSQIKSVTQLLDAQQSSVEIIANICSCEDNDDVGIDTDDSTDNEDMGEENISLDCSGTNETVLPLDKLPPEVTEAMASYEIFERVWARTILPADNVMLILKEYDNSSSLDNKLRNLQSRSLLCVNNMLSSLPLPKLGGVTGIYKIWVDTGKLVFKQTASDNITLLESATAVMRAALDTIKSKEETRKPDENLFSDLALTDIEMMLTGIRECHVPEIRSNLIRMLGTLALLLTATLTETAADVVALITDFILDQAHKESEVWVLAEAVDTLLDLYAEDETDALAARTHLVDRLTALSPLLKNKARQQRKCLGDHASLVHTATSNLPRFIKYKRGRVSKLKH